MIIKKFIVLLALTLCGFSAQAQMTETLGALAIHGELANESYRAVSQGQQAVNRLQFQQDLASIITELQTTRMGNYTGISKENLLSRGLRGVDWDVAETGGDGFVVSIYGIDPATCFTCKTTDFGFYKIDINNGGDCSSPANTVKMYFH